MKKLEFYNLLTGVKAIAVLYILFTAISAVPALAQQTVSINEKDGKQVVAISFDSTTNIQYGEHRIIGKVKESTSVKYSSSDSGKDLKVKLNEKGFKLKDADKLLWKVKLKKNKISVSNNEENKGPCIVKAEATDTVRVYEDDKVIGEVNYGSDGASITSYGTTPPATWKAAQPGTSVAIGVMLCPKIPDLEKNIIMAELIRAGR